MEIKDFLVPIPGENPAGENFRYAPLYDDIQEARRADDQLAQGDWQRTVKTSDWHTVRSLCSEALISKTKDLQIAAWLLESLIVTKGFEGLNIGLAIINGLLGSFWEHLYPEMVDDDIEYRVSPLEFMNDKTWLLVKQVPVTDGQTASAYTLVDYEESREVGSEKDILNAFGDVDVKRKKAREEMLAEGKLSAETFDAAVRSSSRSFYESLNTAVKNCVEQFDLLDETIDQKFERNAPRLAELKNAIQECSRFVIRITDEKRIQEPGSMDGKTPEISVEENDDKSQVELPDYPTETLFDPLSQPSLTESAGTFRIHRLLGSAGLEASVWLTSLNLLKNKGIRPALEHLLGAAVSAQSAREETNFRLLMAKLCLKAERPDLARPLVEELTTLIETLKLEQWESPIWIADALSTLYQCLTAKGASENDQNKAKELLTRLCTLDITKAMECSNQQMTL